MARIVSFYHAFKTRTHINILHHFKPIFTRLPPTNVLNRYGSRLPFSQQTNLRDPALCEAAKRRKTTSGTSPVPTDAPKYRDRAAERREAFNQPAIPLPEDTSQIGQKRKFVEPPSLVAPPPPPPPPPPALEPGNDETNRGNQLLAKMGWTSGTGLGSGGEGRVDPVMVQQFEMRAGLGSSKGQDPTQRQAQNPGQRALDLARVMVDR